MKQKTTDKDMLPDGSMKYSGTLLAFDGVHVNDTGTEIVANLLSQGICDALSK